MMEFLNHEWRSSLWFGVVVFAACAEHPMGSGHEEVPAIRSALAPAQTEILSLSDSVWRKGADAIGDRQPGWCNGWLEEGAVTIDGVGGEISIQGGEPQGGTTCVTGDRRGDLRGYGGQISSDASDDGFFLEGTFEASVRFSDTPGSRYSFFLQNGETNVEEMRFAEDEATVEIDRRQNRWVIRLVVFRDRDGDGEIDHRTESVARTKRYSSRRFEQRFGSTNFHRIRIERTLTEVSAFFDNERIGRIREHRACLRGNQNRCRLPQGKMAVVLNAWAPSEFQNAANPALAATYEIQSVSVPPLPKPPIPTQGLVAYYPFNGNADDESGNGHDGVISGATLVADRSGSPTSAAVSFDGVDDDIRVATSPLLRSANYSVSLWVKTTQTTAGQVVLFSGQYHQNSASGNGYQLEMNSSGNVGADQFTRPSVNHGGGAASGPVNDGAWHHVVVSWDGTTTRAYIDGVLGGTQTTPCCNGANPGPIRWTSPFDDFLMGFTLDIFGGPISDRYLGFLDDIRVYDRALSESEVASLAVE
ncbi:MAG: hypothetical protein MJB57_03955 [Gemmatimonadetes bacterium]|nr:hypothetical protein [Gemmatimonadota bacterium]